MQETFHARRKIVISVVHTFIPCRDVSFRCYFLYNILHLAEKQLQGTKKTSQRREKNNFPSLQS